MRMIRRFIRLVVLRTVRARQAKAEQYLKEFNHTYERT